MVTFHPGAPRPLSGSPPGDALSGPVVFATTPFRVLDVVTHESVGFSPVPDPPFHLCPLAQSAYVSSYGRLALSSPMRQPGVNSDRPCCHVSDHTCLLARRDYSDPNRIPPFRLADRAPWMDTFLPGLSNRFSAGYSLVRSLAPAVTVLLFFRFGPRFGLTCF